MHRVDSTSVEAIGYDRQKQSLHVRFLESRRTYVYEGVEERVFEEFLRAGSKGSYFNQEIKRAYPYRQA